MTQMVEVRARWSSKVHGGTPPATIATSTVNTCVANTTRMLMASTGSPGEATITL